MLLLEEIFNSLLVNQFAQNVAFDDDIPPRSGIFAQIFDDLAGDEVRIDRGIGLNLITLPYQAEFLGHAFPANP